MQSPILSDRCPVQAILSVLSVTLVYCGQTFEWIKMTHGVEVGLGPGHVVLDGDLDAPPPKGPHVCGGKRLYGSRCHLVGRLVS